MLSVNKASRTSVRPADPEIRQLYRMQGRLQTTSTSTIVAAWIFEYNTLIIVLFKN